MTGVDLPDALPTAALAEYNYYLDTQRLRIQVSNMKNSNTRDELDAIKTAVLQHLSQLPAVPSAQMVLRPALRKAADMPEEDADVRGGGAAYDDKRRVRSGEESDEEEGGPGVRREMSGGAAAGHDEQAGVKEEGEEEEVEEEEMEVKAEEGDEEGAWGSGAEGAGGAEEDEEPAGDGGDGVGPIGEVDNEDVEMGGVAAGEDGGAQSRSDPEDFD